MFSRSGPFPAEAGTYLLVFDLGQTLQVPVGRLGVCHLPAGRWAYAGSALGPGGLAGRLCRHFRSPARPYWHIDYLTGACPPIGAVYTLGETRLECWWAQALQAAGAQAPVPGFGNSDCRTPGCPAHLLHLPVPWTFPHIEDLLCTNSS